MNVVCVIIFLGSSFLARVYAPGPDHGILNPPDFNDCKHIQNQKQELTNVVSQLLQQRSWEELRHLTGKFHEVLGYDFQVDHLLPPDHGPHFDLKHAEDMLRDMRHDTHSDKAHHPHCIDVFGNTLKNMILLALNPPTTTMAPTVTSTTIAPVNQSQGILAQASNQTGSGQPNSTTTQAPTTTPTPTIKPACNAQQQVDVQFILNKVSNFMQHGWWESIKHVVLEEYNHRFGIDLHEHLPHDSPHAASAPHHEEDEVKHALDRLQPHDTDGWVCVHYLADQTRLVLHPLPITVAPVTLAPTMPTTTTATTTTTTTTTPTTTTTAQPTTTTTQTTTTTASITTGVPTTKIHFTATSPKAITTATIIKHPKCAAASTMSHVSVSDNVSNTNGGTCSNGDQNTPASLVMDICNAPTAIDHWHMGEFVMFNCNAIPLFTPVGKFETSTYTQTNNTIVGVFLGCDQDGFQMVVQECGKPIKIVHMRKGAADDKYNAYLYNVVQFQ